MSRNKNKTKSTAQNSIQWKEFFPPQTSISTVAAKLFEEQYMKQCIATLPPDFRWRAYTHLLELFYQNSLHSSQAEYVVTAPFFVNVTLNGNSYSLDKWLGAEKVGEESIPGEERRGIVMQNHHFTYFLQQIDALLASYADGTDRDAGYPDDIEDIGGVKLDIPNIRSLNDNFTYGILDGDLYHAYPYGVHIIAAPTGGGKSTFIEHYLTSLGKFPSIKAPTLPFDLITSKGEAEVFSPLINWGEPTALATPYTDQLAKLLSKTLICSEYAIVDSVSKLLLSIDKNIGAGGLSKSIRTMTEELTTFCEISNRKLFLTVNPLDPNPQVYSVLLDLMAGGATSITLADIPRDQSVYISSRSSYNPLASQSTENGVIFSKNIIGSTFDRTENDRFWKKVTYNEDRRKTSDTTFQVKEATQPVTIPTMIDYISSDSKEAGWMTTDPKLLSALALTSSLVDEAEKLRYKR